MGHKLKLKAESQDDILVISAALQDAILRVGEIYYNRIDRFFTLRLSRFAHEDRSSDSRVLTGLRVDGVMHMKSRDIDRKDPEAMMVLLSIEFDPDDAPPGGLLSIKFAGGGEIRAIVESIDVIMADVSEPRQTDKLPLHPA